MFDATLAHGKNPEITTLDTRGFISMYRALVEMLTLLRLYNEKYADEDSIGTEEFLEEHSRFLEDKLVAKIHKEC